MDEDWDAQRMLDLYIYDYLKRKNMHTTAEIFNKEADVMPKQMLLNPPGGFLPEWWSIFWDMYNSHTKNYPIETAESSSKAASVADNGSRNVPHVMPCLDVNYLLHETCQAIWIPEFYNFQDNITSPPISPRPQHMENVLHHASSPMFPGLDNNYSSSMFPGLQHHFSMIEKQEQSIRRLIAAQKLELEHTERPAEKTNSNSHFPSVEKLAHLLTSSSGSSGCCQENIPQNHQLSIARENRTGTDIRKSTFTNKQSTHKTTKTTQGSTNGYGYGHDKLTTSTYPSHSSVEQKLFAASSPCFQHGGVPHMVEQASAALTPSSSKSSTVTHNNELVNYDLEQKNKQVAQNAEVEISPDEDIESFLSNEAMGNESTSSCTPEQSSSDHNKLGKEEFHFSLLNSHAPSDNKLTCCDFSSTGRFLAAAGHEKKIIILDMQSSTGQTLMGHSQLITGIRFKPYSHHFATSSFDRSVKIWNADNLREPLHNLVGHADHVMSLDFHPKKANLLCSCGNDGEVRLWNINDSLCVRAFKGADWMVRFQPQAGNLLAAVSGNVITLIDVETGTIQHRFEGHANDIRSISWDVSGKYMVSISDENSRLWSLMEGGKCVRELHSNGNKFASCTFHPVHPHLVVLGSYQSIGVWNPMMGHHQMTFNHQRAHEGIVSGLASSPEMNMFASVSHDRHIKIWN